MALVSWSLAVDTLRLLSIVSFLFCSLTFTWYSFISLIAVLGEPPSSLHNNGGQCI